MIIACSARALERIEDARRNRIAKSDSLPVVVKGKEEVTAIRTR